MPFEDELTDALHSTGRTFTPDLTTLVNAGVTDGRRRRRRRTLGVLGGVTALAVVGVGGTVASGALNASPAHRQPGPAAGGVPTHRPTATVSPSRSVPVFTAEQMLAAFTAALPKGHISGARSSGITATTKGPYTYVNGPDAAVVFNDGKGPSSISISVGRNALTINDQMVQQYLECPGHIVRPDITCTRTTLPNGNQLTITQGLENPNYGSKEKDWTAYLGTTAGGLIELDETNSAEEKGAVSRPEPALSVTQLKAVVTDPLWAKLAAELPGPVQVQPAPGSHPVQQLSADRIASTLHALLPKGVVLTRDGSGQDGYLAGLLDDGRGPGTIGVNADNIVQAGVSKGTNPKTGKPVTSPDPYAGATVLADGTRILVTRTPAEKGGAGTVSWTVVVLHKDGRRILVSETNAPAVHTAADRTAPVLTLDQLKALALSPAWVASAW